MEIEISLTFSKKDILLNNQAFRYLTYFYYTCFSEKSNIDYIYLTVIFGREQIMFGILSVSSQEEVCLKLAAVFFSVVYFYYIFIVCSA